MIRLTARSDGDRVRSPDASLLTPYGYSMTLITKSRQRLREEVCRLMGHTFTGCRNGLYFIDFCRIEQEGSGASSLRDPIQGFMIILCIEDGLLFLLRRTQY